MRRAIVEMYTYVYESCFLLSNRMIMISYDININTMP